MPTFCHRDYTVALICALPLEMTAAIALLDQRHDDLPPRPNDSNTYILGQIHGHNVAIACLPSGVYGTTSAATVAIQMQSTFESIRFGLLAGIGGGVPSENTDIRLGDVVVSKPTTNLGGVIQYDYGKTVAGGRFERTGVLNKPPPVLLTAVSRLQAEHRLKPSKIPAVLSEAVARNPEMREKFTYRGEDHDILFDSEYDHTDDHNGLGDTCDNCDTRRLVKRVSRPSHDPVIHYGLIASGNQVVKHGHSRDKLARELDILCFEMEAAGLMDTFPCLVIRGICDYSDSHKNKQWQEYSALTAAAYGKELLSVVHASLVMDTLPAGVLPISDVSYWREEPSYTAKLPRSEIVQNDSQAHEEILERMSSYDHERVHRRLSRKRLAGTTRWFIDHPEFRAWFIEKRISSLWCSGKIGSGKTMIATAVVDAAKYELGSPTVFFYCETENQTELSASNLLSSFIRQLYGYICREFRSYLESITKEITKFFGRLKSIFTLCFRGVPNAFYVIDGLDALDREHGKFIMELFKSLLLNPGSQNGARILLLSRDQVPGYINISTFIPGIHQISTSANIMKDISTYIESSITDKTMCRTLTDDHLLIEEIKQRLLTESSGMFLWVYLQLEILWDTCHTDAEIRSALSALPKGLEETYSRCIERIDEKDTRALKVLKWVSFATRPLHIEELREAVAFGQEDTAWNAQKIPRKEYVIGCCANLVVMDSTDDHVYFAHSSIKQYLEKGRERKMQWYPSPTRGILECGELCLAYLSFSDFSLQLEPRKKENATARIQAPSSLSSPILLARYTLPRLLTRPFMRGSWNQRPSISMPFRQIRTSSTPDQLRYKFLAYAVTHWALQTKKINRESPSWPRFERLATCFNETWNIHPWPIGGRSYFSHIHSLFGWAVKEQHQPLLSIALGAGADLKRVCDLPLFGESLPALHVAAKFGCTTILGTLLRFRVCTINLPDIEGYTALHHAASRGHFEICQLLSREKEIKMDVRSISQCTPLWLAASNGHENVVSFLTSLDDQVNVEAKDDSFGQTPLSRAVENGHEAVVKVLLGKGADIEAKSDASGQTPLSLAVENGHEAVTKLLLKMGAEIEGKALGERIFSWAARDGHEAMMKLLIKRGTDIETAFIRAAEDGNKAVVKILFEKGAGIDEERLGKLLLSRAARNGHEAMMKLLIGRGVDIETALIWAAEDGHEAVVKLLLKIGADIEAKPLKSGETPLIRAAQYGHETVVKLLLEKGADIEAKNKSGETPLLRAIFDIAGNGHEAMVRLLLKRGANIEAKDKLGETPLMGAAWNGYEAVVKLLLERGADIETKNELGQTPLARAAECGREAVVKLLLEKGADIEAKDESGETPLIWATRKKYEAVVKLLLERGADIETKNELGQTPLIYAAQYGHEGVVKLLLERGADIEGENKSGETPLLAIMENGYVAMVKLLLERGADIEAKDESGQTPLARAAECRQEAVAKLLLKRGADIEAKNETAETPLVRAAEYGRKAVVKLLVR
ncbi:hypothetical protein PENSTE_c006G08700 [Penicillium steckii]|uniref:Uncharacterized protein n=1 Tax=Penicillium steckii TaxID=303698 RepID=A0A1V6TGI4_9EURO|nr:hypothetical protein PENSTE_c006G08700 [Penicillium steckii]